MRRSQPHAGAAHHNYCFVAEEPPMTREQVEQALGELERLLAASRTSDDVDEQRQLANDYHRLWRKVRPYVEGEKPYSDDPEKPIT
jgi:hypothetical protein